MAWLRDPAAFWALGNTPFAREARYAQMLAYGLSQRESGALTDAVQGGWAMGSEDFVQSLQSKTVRRLHKKSAGRPRLVDPSAD
jgi:putative transposase